jgi:hypothetical protein
MPSAVEPFASRDLRKGVRLGVSRQGDFKPIVNLVFATDGGIMLAPAPVPGASWRYSAVLPSQVIKRGTYHEVSVRPKLHYHSSGYVAASLDGTRLPKSSASYPSLDHLTSASPLLSVIATRPWELASAIWRKGDVATLEASWPWAIGYSFSILDVPDISKTRIDLFGGDRGLLSGDSQRFVFDLRQFGRQGVLIAHLRIRNEPNLDVEASITAAAYPVTTEGTAPKEVFALWSSTARNPAIISYIQ